MITPFNCSETEKIIHGRFSKKLPQDIQLLAARKLTMLHLAKSLMDFHILPANCLKALSVGRTCQHVISEPQFFSKLHSHLKFFDMVAPKICKMYRI